VNDIAGPPQLGGEKVWGSIEEVHDDALDPDGFYEQPKGGLQDLTRQNLALVDRLQIDIDKGRDWDRIDLTGHDLNRLLESWSSQLRRLGHPNRTPRVASFSGYHAYRTLNDAWVALFELATWPPSTDASSDHRAFHMAVKLMPTEL